MSDLANPIRTRRADFVGICSVMAFASVLVGSVWQVEGWLASQKLVVSLLMPIGVAWLVSLLMAVRAAWRADRRTAALFGCGFVFLTVFFSPILNRYLMRRLESTVPIARPLDPDAPRYRAVVVLGGGTSLDRAGRPQFDRDGQRVATAAQMWHANKVDAIICTGDDHYIPAATANEKPSADRIDLWHPGRQGVELLASLGVPRDRLFRIQGVNTIAEMDSLQAFLESPPDAFPRQGTIALVTSAFHMPRALRLAKSKGLDLTPIPVGYRTTVEEPIALTDLVPSADAGGTFMVVAREYLAGLVGR